MYNLKYKINGLDHENSGITEIVNANSQLIKIKENEYIYNVSESENKIFLELMELLKSWTEFADKNKITWWAIGGTALGAVRHQGFIPWDNDIDIGVHYKDYEKLLNLSNNNKNRIKMCGPIRDNREKLWYFCDIFKGQSLDKNQIENVNVIKFENYKLNVPKQTDVFLSNAYGNDYNTKMYLSRHVNAHELVSEKLKLRSVANNILNIMDHYDNEKEDKNKKISYFLANLMLQNFNKEFNLKDTLQQIKDFLISRQ